MPLFSVLSSRRRVRALPGGASSAAPDRFYVCLIEVPSDKGFDQAGIHINHVGLVVDDIDETVRRIRALGLRLEGNAATFDWPRSRSAYVMDPNGILIEITNRFGGGLG
jgi:catechol 2,3-dioxygenase-like lactoylglutathione lyase family enzyme